MMDLEAWWVLPLLPLLGLIVVSAYLWASD